MERDPVIIDAVRTPIGRFRGALKDVRPDDLAAVAIRALVERTRIPAERIDDVILGCANQAGEDNRNVARMALLLAGLPQTVPGLTVNRLCGSGLEAVLTAARAIRAGEGELYVAGGVESMTRAPFAMPKSSTPFPNGNLTVYDTSLGWRFPNPRMEALFPLEAMGETAENLAERYAIPREAQDRFALQSHERAVAAQRAGRFADELCPVTVSAAQPKGPAVTVSADESPRPDSSLEALGKLGPVFRKGGSVTAGNSSGLNDGAAAVLVASAECARKLGLTPLGRIVAGASAGVDPRVMGIGPGAGHAQGAGPGRLVARRSRSRRAQRGIRGAVAGRAARPRGPRARAGQRQWRRHRARPPPRVLGRAHRRHLDPRDAPPRRAAWPGHHVHRCGPGHRRSV